MTQTKPTKEAKKDKSLRNKAVDIKGKPYVPVPERVIYFNEHYPDGSIISEILSDLKDPHIIMRATVVPDDKRPEKKFVAHSQETVGEGYINKTSALENAETSAVGRALAMMGIGVIESIASSDEVNKANNQAPKPIKNEGTAECEVCGAVANKRSGEKFVDGVAKPWSGIFCTDTQCNHVTWTHLKQ